MVQPENTGTSAEMYNTAYSEEDEHVAVERGGGGVSRLACESAFLQHSIDIVYTVPIESTH